MSTSTAGYGDAIGRTASMTGDRDARNLAAAHGLDILDVTWEDTGRYKGSAVGPNITDCTIQVQHRGDDGRDQLAAMPVIRYPNFADRSADLSPDKLFVRVGNERGEALQTLSLSDYLARLTEHLARPEHGGVRGSLVGERDTHVLVSAQACFLPVPRSGLAEFNPVVFNYQSSRGNPAVLVVLATREGTSATVIDNARDPFEAGATWGQRVFFNKDGERCSLTAERLSDFRTREEGAASTAPAPPDSGLDLVLLVQVPLVHKELAPTHDLSFGMSVTFGSFSLPPPGSALRSSDVEAAVLGHGKVEGPYTELDGLTIERDLRFPIRVTVQFYKATSNGVVDEKDLAGIRASIDRVYADADFVGSLVVEGETTRPTEHGDPQRTEPPSWWDDFWSRHQASTGESQAEAMARWHRLFGDGWRELSPEEAARVVRSGRIG